MASKFSIAEKEISFLKVELAKLAKEKDEEKASNCELSNEIEIMKAKEENHMKIVEQHSQDLADLKKALVTCTL